MSANMPSWDELVASFLVNRFRNESKKNLDDNIVDELARIAKLNSDNSPISQTRFIKQNIEPEIYLELLKNLFIITRNQLILIMIYLKF